MKKGLSDSKLSKYLPSKTFTKVVGGAMGILAVIFILFFVFSGKASFLSGNGKKGLYLEGKTVGDLVKTDTDLDGVADWEEALWGTDKNKKETFEGIPDGSYIAGKKKSLNIEQSSQSEEENITETEKFAKQFFASYTALKQSGEADPEAINRFSNAMGEQVVSSELEDVYKDTDVKISDTDTSADRKKYYSSIKAMFEKYKEDGIGTELGVFGDGLSSSNGGVFDEKYSGEMLAIGEAYRQFAKDMMGMSVPKSMTRYHLTIANAADKTGASVQNMGRVTEDPVMSIAGLSEYQKHSQELIGIVAVLEKDLSDEQ